MQNVHVSVHLVSNNHFVYGAQFSLKTRSHKQTTDTNEPLIGRAADEMRTLCARARAVDGSWQRAKPAVSAAHAAAVQVVGQLVAQLNQP